MHSKNVTTRTKFLSVALGLICLLGGGLSAAVWARATGFGANDAKPLPDAALVQASESKACTIEGSISLPNQLPVVTRDCMQNDGSIPADQFRQMCDGLAKAGSAFGLGTAATVTFSSQCIAKTAQGQCKGIFKSGVTAFYYKREPSSLPDLEKSCVAQGGKWVLQAKQ
jgi:hypothetical protein